MKCQRCGNECTISHCEFCKGIPMLSREVNEIEQKVRDIDSWIGDAIEFRNKFLDELEYLLRQMPRYQETRSIKAQAFSYWAAHIKSALADDNYHNPVATTIATTIKSLWDELDIDYPNDVDVFDYDYDIEKVIENLVKDSE